MADISITISSLAADQIERWGEAATLLSKGAPTYDPSTGTTAQTTTTLAIKLIPWAYRTNEIAGNVLAGDTRFITNAPIAQNDGVIFDGATWRIINVEQVRLTGNTILYIAQARK